MTSAAPPLAAGAQTAGPAAASATRDPKAQANDRRLASAAHQFEGVLVQQMLKVLWQSSPVLAGPQGEMYRQMFEGALADHMVSAGGIGLSPMLERALGQKAGAQPEALHSVHRGTAIALGPLPAPVPVPAAGATSNAVPGRGELSQIQAAAAELLQDGGKRWSRKGALQPRDLFADLGAGGTANASVAGARGYQGYYKCNLFALEVARRAGFAVPLRASEQGFGYPLSNDITRDAADGQVSAGWAHVVTGESSADLDASLEAGTRALMLTGEGSGERHGHMAVVERVHSIQYGPSGDIQRIVFDGWEARPEGAMHLRERSWNAHGHTGGHDPRNGFQRIEILELRRQIRLNPPLIPASQPRQDDLGSSLKPHRPIHSSEEDS